MRPRHTIRPALRVIFLDIDGVLNTVRTPLTSDLDMIDRSRVALLSALVQDVDAHIVISSAWREHFSLDALRMILKIRGLKDAHTRIIGYTPVLARMSQRGQEIQHWLDANPDVQSYVILDDNDWFDGIRHRFVQTTEQYGLTSRHIERAKAHLLRPITTKEVDYAEENYA